MDSNKIKKGLGRGLSSLIGETKIDTTVNKLSIGGPQLALFHGYNALIENQQLRPGILCPSPFISESALLL